MNISHCAQKTTIKEFYANNKQKNKLPKKRNTTKARRIHLVTVLALNKARNQLS